MKRYTVKRLRSSLWFALLSACLLGLTELQIENASALSISLTFDNSGEPTGDLFGGGTLENVVQAAADYWMEALPGSPINQSIDVSWSSLGGSTLGRGGTSWTVPGNALTGGTLEFDNDGTTEFFLDPTPYDNSEWSSFTPTQQDLGGGSVNVGRVYSGPTGAAVSNSDLLSVAIHEIGHALGILSAYPPYEAARDTDGNSSDLDISAPRPFPGSEIPVTDGHIDLPTAAMSTTITSGERMLLGGADILLLAEVHGVVNVNLDPQPVPEPTGALLFSIGALGVLAYLARRGR